MKTIMDLQTPDCRFICGLNADGDSLYCSEVKSPGYSYCPSHVEWTTGKPPREQKAPGPVEFPRPVDAFKEYTDRAPWKYDRNNHELDLVSLLEV